MSYVLALEGSLPLPLVAAYTVAGILIFCFFCLGLRWKQKTAYSSAYFFVGALLCVCAFFSEEGGGDGAMLTAFVCVALYGVSYPLLCGALAFESYRKKKALRFGEERRVEKFLLPDKDNAYLRERLETSLCPKEEAQVPIEQAFQLTFVKRTLAKLKEKDLSPADRVELESIEGEVAGVCAQKTLTGAQLRMVNTRFSRLLKLAAKYAV